MQKLVTLLFAWILLSLGSLLTAPYVVAAEGEVLGIHILQRYELDAAHSLLKPSEEAEDKWHYFTIPLTLDDLDKQSEWQQFFNDARGKKLIPIVRLTTRFDAGLGAWIVPNRKQVADQVSFLSELEWPTSDRTIIVYNEPNHKAEWGGNIDPASYAEVLDFASRWAKSEDKNFKVLPAGLDLAAPQGSTTAEAFWYLDQMLAANPDVFSHIDYWNSHSYPNPGFVSGPQRTEKNSLRGFQHELAYLKQETGRDFQVFITETGWRETPATRNWLASYYQYALQHIWSDARVKAVTPFVLQGDPGPFAEFTFIDQAGNQTLQYGVYQELLRQQAGS